MVFVNLLINNLLIIKGKHDYFIRFGIISEKHGIFYRISDQNEVFLNTRIDDETIDFL
jgi:hypothetical protein